MTDNKVIRVGAVSIKSAHRQGFGIATAFDEYVALFDGVTNIKLAVDNNDYPKAKDIDILHMHTFGIRTIFALVFKYRKVKKVITAHIMPKTVENMFPARHIWHPIVFGVMKYYFNRADMLIAISESNRQDLEELTGHKNIKLLPLQVNTSDFMPATDKTTLRTELNLNNHFTVVASGHIQLRKRFDIFVDTARKLPDVQFIWVGGVMYNAGKGALETTKALNNLPENVIVTGILPRDKGAKYVQAADILIMPSDQETFGLAIVEGATAQVPVIARNLPEYIQNFGDNILHADTADEFADEIAKLQNDTEYYAGAQQGSSAIYEKFSASTEQHLNALIECYTELV